MFLRIRASLWLPAQRLNGRALARTAAVTLSSNTIGGVCGAGATPVPTLSQWAFLMLAVLLAAAGAVALRRRTSA
jgi:hypothetical protein